MPINGHRRQKGSVHVLLGKEIDTKHGLDAKNPKRKPLIDLCKTRWVDRVHAFRHFYQAFTSVVEALEMMVYGSDLAVCTFWAPWDAKNKTEALKHLTQITNFNFIMAFVTAYRAFSVVEEITTGLQGRGVDVYKAYKAAIEVKKEYQHMQDTAADFTAQCFEHAKQMGAAVGTEPTAPRAARVQRNRADAPAENPEEAYKRNLVIPLLDHILSEMEARFQSVSASAGVLYVLCCRLCCLQEKTHIRPTSKRPMVTTCRLLSYWIWKWPD